MGRKIKINSLPKLLNWIDNSKICFVTEKDEDCFTIQAPNDATWQIQFDKNSNIDNIISKTIEQLEEFEADEIFTELWNAEFAKHNNFSPLRFITMLKKDEETFRNLADKLREHFGNHYWFCAN